jgi:glycosyltransferase involved in cell wall biosynthesis
MHPNKGSPSGTSSEHGSNVELSVVIPCLDEAVTVAQCVKTAIGAMHENQIDGEVIVADNGSTDGSAEIARNAGARVIQVATRGYGGALMGGIAASRGPFIIMGDADGSYDFSEIPRLLNKLREGYDLVQGCRLPSGGGTILPGAMPFLHRWFGNPTFSLIAKAWFKSPIHDVNCGLRGFTREHFEKLHQKCTGMEFATEMIVKSSAIEARITEVPITLYPDGRRGRAPHLKTFRDGWRTLRFLLLFCPRWLFVIPGIILTTLGVLGYSIALPGLQIRGVRFDVHTLVFASLAILCGYQSVFFGIFAEALAMHDGILPEQIKLNHLLQRLKLEYGLIAGAAGLTLGLSLLLAAFNQWRVVHFGDLNYTHTMRYAVPGSTLTALGFQTIINSFFLSLLELPRATSQEPLSSTAEFDQYEVICDPDPAKRNLHLGHGQEPLSH